VHRPLLLRSFGLLALKLQYQFFGRLYGFGLSGTNLDYEHFFGLLQHDGKCLGGRSSFNRDEVTRRQFDALVSDEAGRHENSVRAGGFGFFNYRHIFNLRVRCQVNSQ
jgi:hypothetical protein